MCASRVKIDALYVKIQHTSGRARAFTTGKTMTTVRLSMLALLTGTALLSISCSGTSGTPSGSSCVRCLPGFVCGPNGECLRLGGEASGGSAGSPGTDAGTPPGMGAPGAGVPGSTAGSGSGGASNGGSDPAPGSAGTSSGTAGAGGSGGGTPNPGAGGSNGGGTNGPFCASCSADADCGGGNNFCLAFSFGNYCGTDCSSGQPCANGANCVSIGDGSGNVVGMNCIPAGTDCSGVNTGGGPTGSGNGSGGSSGTGSGSCTTDTWSSFGSSFFQNYCNNCHGSEFSSHSAVQARPGSIGSSISSGSMPPGGLSGSIDSRIIKYLNCGAP